MAVASSPSAAGTRVALEMKRPHRSWRCHAPRSRPGLDEGKQSGLPSRDHYSIVSTAGKPGLLPLVETGRAIASVAPP